jgi:probable HAF family extracellular repeat protein
VRRARWSPTSTTRTSWLAITRISLGFCTAFKLSNGKPTNIDDPGGTLTRPSGINKSGVIVGSYTKSGRLQAFLYEGRKFSDIGPSGSTASGAFGINDQQEITGEFVDSSGSEHGFLLKAGKYTTLDVPGGTFTEAYGINNSGTITLMWGNSSGRVESSIYRNSKYTTIDVPGATSSFAHSIDSAGDVIFTWLDSSGNFHGALLRSGKYYDFEDPNGNSAGNGINDHHVIVGAYLIATQAFGGYRATY